MKRRMSEILTLSLIIMTFCSIFTTGSASETFTINVTVSGNGTVTPQNPVVESGETVVFTCTPNDNNTYVSQILFNGNPVIVNLAGEYETPEIIENSTLEVTFSEKTETEIGITTFQTPYYPRPKSAITFGTVKNALGFEIVEYGILCHESEEDMTIDTPGVRKFVATSGSNSSGQYGIELVNSLSKIPPTYKTRAYAIYKQNGVVLEPVYATQVINIDESNYYNDYVIKEVTLTPNVMADKKTGEAVFNFYGSPSSFPYSLNLISNSPIYSVNARTMFVNFANPLPEDAQIINAQIKLRAIATGTPKYIDILNCLSTDWVDNPAKYNDAGEYPLVEETALNADDDVLVEVGTFSTWSYYTFDLNPQMLNASSDFNFNIRSRTVSGDYFCPQLNGNGIPQLKITYKEFVNLRTTVNVTTDYVGQKQVSSADFTVWQPGTAMPAEFAGNSGNYNEKSLRLSSSNESYTNTTRWGYLNFSPNIPEGAIITKVTLDFWYRRATPDLVPTTSVEVFKCTDSSWLTNPSSFGAYTYPLPGATRLHIEDAPSTVATGTQYNAVLELDPSQFSDRIFNLALRQKEVGHYDYTYVRLEPDKLPKLIIEYVL